MCSRSVIGRFGQPQTADTHKMKRAWVADLGQLQCSKHLEVHLRLAYLRGILADSSQNQGLIGILAEHQPEIQEPERCEI